ncbi:MAG: serine/threonine protein kinase [Candidatus Hydrogenedentes bacterium]|nr:serine/threonine protein kinase [Candidatus Hydrogenedentota bacterium]
MRSHGGALPARHILGNYELFEEIGRGGMGVVYRALDLSLDRIVAVKILHDDLRAQPQIVSRFNREAKAAACLDHPNIVQIYAVGNVEGTPFIAMEYVDAAPLSALMQRESNLHWAQALDIAGQVSAALACAHDAHVIHRDIKPPNILITDRGKAYVTDFGIAKILTADDHLTLDGSRLGTPHYMSPERCKNGNLTGASDLYSLGVLLFQMLSGRLPYEAA